MITLARLTVLLALLVISSVSIGQSRDVYTFDSREMEERFQNLTAELRCPKCQNQNIADSNAPISEDMRNEVYRMMQEGASNEEITGALVARFGEFVRYKPQVDSRTILLWATPALAVFIGVLIVLMIVRRSGPKTNDRLTDEERARASRLLNERDRNGSSS